MYVRALKREKERESLVIEQSGERSPGHFKADVRIEERHTNARIRKMKGLSGRRG